MPWEERVAVSLEAAEIISRQKRSLVNASTMLCQSKTCLSVRDRLE